ncbi:MAG: flagellar assembly peptidoglycan hydrolase FlgJ [Sulfuritalea sp.]|nr:flagellar assembly peptidoglycan hydrolase FlgJ [Sulfuritalea sp.]
MTSTNEAASLSATSSVLDNGRLAGLKRQARAGDPAATREVAKQFEALFMQMVLKSMRDATPREGLFDSQASRLYESLHDQQLSLTLGGGRRGLGLAEMIEKQLLRQNQMPGEPLGPLPLRPEPVAYPLDTSRSKSLRDLPVPATGPKAVGRPASANIAVSPAPSAGDTATGSAGGITLAVGGASPAQRAFVDRLMPAALNAERSTGIPAHFMVAQAALETGWGRSEPGRADGGSSFNVFGIKAGVGWKGATAEAATTEVIAGLAQTRVERFRAYGSYEEAFRDYANLLAGSPRYLSVLGAREPQHFARGLQAAGYATDPEYASKLERIIGGAALRQTLSG